MEIPQGPFCQSCSMPMTSEEHFGTEADGSQSKDYCTYCYQQGKFTQPEITMEGMVDYLAANWGKWTNRPDLTSDDAKPEIKGILSNLKRWKS